MSLRIEVYAKRPAPLTDVLHGAAALGIQSLTGCTRRRLYFLSTDLAHDQIDRLCRELLVDPVTEAATWGPIEEATQGVPGGKQEARIPTHIVEVAFRPGVTDVPARELSRGMAEMGFPLCEAATGTRYELEGDLSADEVRRIARQLLSNETVQHFALGTIRPHFGVEATASDRVESVKLSGLSDSELLSLSKKRLLSLDVAEMRTIQEFYQQAGREPTDVELETLAQTWSEHCVHKTFKASIHFTHEDAAGRERASLQIEGLLRQYIRAATDAVHPDWLRSAFVDNAGIIAFDDESDLAFKVETHNHPSALEPFGGANTGVGGVVRDILGVSARPIAATNVLCFGPQDFPHADLPAGILHPQRIASGVVAGIADYGNKLGLPTANGAVLFDAGYLGNPLVFCGCAGLLPRGSHPTSAQAGDLVVVVGGRTGRDGLHGATFSSAELTHETSESAGSAVQIGDPITEKGLIELIEAARDEQLYHAVTDCGAGGLSSAVGEMGSKVGVDVELTHVALKYPGLAPWEIWLSEAQERMVLAVPQQAVGRLEELARLWDVEMSVLGAFTGDGDLNVRYAGRIVGAMPMEFLHDGLPQRRMQAVWRAPSAASGPAPYPKDAKRLLLQMLAHPNVASKESVVRRYDHEVRGGTLVRPFCGPQLDGPSDAAVLKPLGTWHHERAFSLAVGINPLIGRVDPYAMAISAIDEAFRNSVAVGADPDRVALLDNFCWGNPTYPDRLGALVRACQGCYDGALAYRAPFISGKDSLYNEFNGKPIPGTLLISAIAIVPEMNRCTTSALKRPGNLLYLLGETLDELGGSLLHVLLGRDGGVPPSMPEEPLTRYRSLHRAMLDGLVASCHDLSEGGLAVAAAEMAIGGRLGLRLALPPWLATVHALFSESNGRLLIEVAPEDAAAFEAHFSGQSLAQIGIVQDDARLVIAAAAHTLVDAPLAELVAAWKGTVQL